MQVYIRYAPVDSFPFWYISNVEVPLSCDYSAHQYLHKDGTWKDSTGRGPDARGFDAAGTFASSAEAAALAVQYGHEPIVQDKV